MTHIVSAVAAYDKKRWKVTLDEGAVTFLLYRGEMKQAGLKAPRQSSPESPELYNGLGMPMQLPEEKTSSEETAQEISEETWQKIREEILLPRAKKRVLFYLKNGDKSEFQMRRKLREGLYPEEIIDEVLVFLRKYRLADDSRYAENCIRQMEGTRSRREIEAKLSAKGLKGETVKQLLSEIPQEEEYAAAEKALAKHFTGDRRRDYAYLARKGFSGDAVQHAMNQMNYEQQEDTAFDF